MHSLFFTALLLFIALMAVWPGAVLLHMSVPATHEDFHQVAFGGEEKTTLADSVLISWLAGWMLGPLQVFAGRTGLVDAFGLLGKMAEFVVPLGMYPAPVANASLLFAEAWIGAALVALAQALLVGVGRLLLR